VEARLERPVCGAVRAMTDVVLGRDRGHPRAEDSARASATQAASGSPNLTIARPDRHLAPESDLHPAWRLAPNVRGRAAFANVSAGLCSTGFICGFRSAVVRRSTMKLSLVVGAIRKALAPGAAGERVLAYEGQTPRVNRVRRPCSMLLVRTIESIHGAEN